MRKTIIYTLSIAAIILITSWIFNHISAWGSIFFVVIIVAAWLWWEAKNFTKNFFNEETFKFDDDSDEEF